MPILRSTRNLTTIHPATATTLGVGVFEYTDHWSVFHYGRMPDPIPGKGEATCHMAVHTFRLLEAAGVATHFRRQVSASQIEFDLASIPDLGGAPLTPGSVACLLPVQSLFRNELPAGSSVHRRVADGTLRPADVGLTGMPAVGERLAQPLIEYATMLDPVNRYIGEAEAQRLTGLSDSQIKAMRDITITVNRVLAEHAHQAGLRLCDGKVEFMLSGEGHMVVADSPGTPDECRLTWGGVPCGKQILRDWYVAHGLEVPVKRLIAQGVPRDQWPRPAPLPRGFAAVMSEVYRALADTWTGRHHGTASVLDTAARAAADLIR
ncbi:phosphoribosylaminoimidazolesuccinocarboxamide synthase [Actinomadura harenae]|uniref:phosphoribosylaminoimidazolesuccinocarboxamide synthase n=1 Tax=Actinomadura harenae TaxID=2483351 RepID=A0A3M2LMC5_9ACTN|nr:phosphoribosylaminoimidazolesuccinocarboxamide synthase [Actinomadura harenae]RMI38614.1 phosphoribosylaminoimidazolesuccinocarboxamide synthase [Actinomadura harenae]